MNGKKGVKNYYADLSKFKQRLVKDVQANNRVDSTIGYLFSGFR